MLEGFFDCAFDAADRLASVTLPGGATTLNYTYDDAGRRLSASDGVATTEYLWDAYSAYGNILMETGGGSQVTYTVAQGNILSQSDGTDTFYLHADALGSTRLLTDETGSVLMAQTFDPYGNLYESESINNTKSAYGFAGEQSDSSGNR